MNTVRADRDGVQDTIADPAAAARWLRAARPEIGIAGWEAVAELRDLRDALRLLAAATTGDDRASAVAATADLTAAVGVVNRACARAPSWSELQWPREDAPAGVAAKARSASRAGAANEAGTNDAAGTNRAAGTDRGAGTDREAGTEDDTWMAGGAGIVAGGPRRVARTAHAPALAAVAAIAEEAVALFAGPDRLLLRACRAPGCVLYFVRNHPRRAWCSDGCGNRARVARHYQRHHGSGREGD